jgi:8-oxo-dGTP pyrophosphatase MutT (NUDIX family)
MVARANELRLRLDGHTAADAAEALFLAQMSALCDQPGDPFARTQYAPGHFTASAFILSPERDALLLIFHDKLQRWLQPGGHIDPDDRDVLAAALREVREEVGICELALEPRGLLDVDVHEIPARKSEPAHRHFDLRFLFRASTRAFRAGSDARAARWLALDQISAEFADRSVMRAVDKILACERR